MFGTDAFTLSEQVLIKATALETLRHAYWSPEAVVS
jgi:hypothetical protein